jgi:hypothetical protein
MSAEKVGRALSFGEAIAEAQAKQAKDMEYVKATGKCCVCKKNPVVPEGLRCAACVKKTDDILKKLRGPGFVEISVGRRP